MSSEQKFLVKYGIHNFVSYTENRGKFTFFICQNEREGMISHAKMLIQGGYGEATDIRLT
ncbi:hypothetical protein MTBPR1_120081 [Candidatus Terasakiella magnetica]|uniref:Uncharacterized protein n=1 Tax=Candidatus Terasakiella magnetica TaxID=1867952 RepID=A0A1C3RET7_9PROT|nr:hypothetical protein [Candidatus Terasakiella magnetica]SCA55775.1 hypothetical protein MTBPR1_120081 [Candidatus Terasakiella magnetica]